MSTSNHRSTDEADLCCFPQYSIFINIWSVFKLRVVSELKVLREPSSVLTPVTYTLSVKKQALLRWEKIMHTYSELTGWLLLKSVLETGVK